MKTLPIFLFAALGSALVAAEVNIPKVAKAHAVEKRYQCVDTDAELQAWVARLQLCTEFAFDTETTSLNPLEAELVGISLAVEPGLACYIPLQHRTGAKSAKAGKDLFDLPETPETDRYRSGPAPLWQKWVHTRSLATGRSDPADPRQ